MSINDIQDDIIEEFSSFDDWMDKYSMLIELGNSLPEYPEDKRTDQYRIEGCQSNVWISAEIKDGIIHYEADSDAILVKGMVALLLRVLNDRTPDEILNADLYFVERIGLSEHLSPTRSNGLRAMLKQIKIYALVFKEKQ